MYKPKGTWIGPAAILILLWMAGLYLRIPILLAPPLAPKISAELELGQTATGALTTLPTLMLAIGAIIGSLVVGKIGPRHAVVVGLSLATVASVSRGVVPPTTVLFVATALMGLGIAVMQPAMPALANEWCPEFVAVAVGVYMNGMYTGEFLSAGLTQVAVLPLVDGSWRGALVFWTAPVLVLVAALYVPRSRAPSRKTRSSGMIWPNWRDGTMWQLGLLLSAASTLYLGTNAYMADILDRGGHALQQALFWLNVSQIGASLVLILLAQYLVSRRLPLIVTSFVSTVAGVCLVFLGGATALVAAFLLGMSTAIQLMLLIMAVPQHAHPGEIGRMTAGMFAIGYAMAFIVPLVSGLLAEAVGVPWMAMLPMLGYAAATVPLAYTLQLGN